MSDREKLIELLTYKACDADMNGNCNGCKYELGGDCFYERMADRLIANGVTVQKWIPVSDMLPRFMQIVLVTDGKHVYKAALNTKNKWIGDYINSMTFKATHWMPMPKPPK